MALAPRVCSGGVLPSRTRCGTARMGSRRSDYAGRCYRLSAICTALSAAPFSS